MSYKAQTLAEIMAELREFRSQQPKHDLSVLRRRYPEVKKTVKDKKANEDKEPDHETR